MEITPSPCPCSPATERHTSICNRTNFPVAKQPRKQQLHLTSAKGASKHRGSARRDRAAKSRASPSPPPENNAPNAIAAHASARQASSNSTFPDPESLSRNSCSASPALSPLCSPTPLPALCLGGNLVWQCCGPMGCCLDLRLAGDDDGAGLVSISSPPASASPPQRSMASCNDSVPGRGRKDPTLRRNAARCARARGDGGSIGKAPRISTDCAAVAAAEAATVVVESPPPPNAPPPRRLSAVSLEPELGAMKAGSEGVSSPAERICASLMAPFATPEELAELIVADVVGAVFPISLMPMIAGKDACTPCDVLVDPFRRLPGKEEESPCPPSPLMPLLPLPPVSLKEGAMSFAKPESSSAANGAVNAPILPPPSE